jgi:hypothetical protein
LKLIFTTETPIPTEKLAKDLIKEIQTLLGDSEFPLKLSMVKDNKGEYTVLKEIEFDTDFKKTKTLDPKLISHTYEQKTISPSKINQLKNWCKTRNMLEK